MNHNRITRRILYIGLMLSALAMLPGCATKKPGETIEPTAKGDEYIASNDTHDPFEPVNRGIFKVNEVIDGMLLQPVAHIYRGLMPEPGQRGLRNVLSNLATPIVLLNSVLQWDMPNAEHTVERFVINSTAGVAGIFDVATGWGIPRAHKKDFGQTMGVYGVGAGPYIFLPILGPSDARDTLGLVADLFSDPFTYILTTGENVVYFTTIGVVRRTDLLPLTDSVYKDSFDPYATFRSIYLQHREKAVRDYLGGNADGLEKETGN